MLIRLLLSPVVALVLLLVCAAFPTGAAPVACNDDRTVVQSGDTLSAIAQRCNTPEGTILALNPQLIGSGDLQVGTTVRVGPRGGAGARFAQTLSRLARQANGALDRLGDRIGPSAQEFLDRNPEWKSRLDGILGQYGSPDVTSEALLAVAPLSKTTGAAVGLTGKGLPKNVPVTIGAGPPGVAYRVIQSSETTAAGTVETSVSVAADVWSSPTVFVIADAEGRVIARSEPVEPTR